MRFLGSRWKCRIDVRRARCESRRIIHHSAAQLVLLLEHFLHSFVKLINIYGFYILAILSRGLESRQDNRIAGTLPAELRIPRPRRISSRIHPDRINTNAQVGAGEIVGTYGKGAPEDKRARA